MKKFLRVFMFLIMTISFGLILSSVSFAQDAPTLGQVAISTSQTSVATAISAVTDKLPAAQSSTGIIMIIGLLSEVAMRVWPSASPMSWIYGAAAALKAITALLTKLGGWLDLVLQNVKK